METKEDQADLFREFFDDGEFSMDKVRELSELMMRYNSAIREVRTKFEVLNDELSLKTSRNPIESIQSRVKKALSIAQKLRRLGKSVTVENISKELNDVAGVRVVCCQARRYHRRRGKRLYPQAQTERISQLSHDRRGPRIFFGE